jgi:hypothetical protein
MTIPIVIFHSGDQPYFKACVETNARNNVVYLVGDNSNKDMFLHIPNVHFFHIDELKTDEIRRFEDCFVNYSTNNFHKERFCFLRIFYVKSLLKKTGIQWMFHIDSDCIMLCDINTIFKDNLTVAYSVQDKIENPYHIASSVHNSLIHLEFCERFVQLCFDIYQNKTKFSLIQPKIQWHAEKQMPGGICDMTLYHLMFSEKIIHHIDNLNNPRLVDGENVVFDHNILDSYGFNGDNTYIKKDGVKVMQKIGNKYYFITRDGTLVRTMSLHFQGGAKRYMETFVLDV